MNLSKKNNLVSSSNYKNFKIVSDFKSSGDQPGAIKSLVDNLLKGEISKLYLDGRPDGEFHANSYFKIEVYRLV